MASGQHLKGLLVVALFLFALTPVASGGEDLSKKHDYATVDISKLGPLELTFVPEWRKEPILKALLKGAQWRLKPDVPQAPYCQAMLGRLLAWDGVEIVEPTIRANRYGDPVFATWRERCPEMTPHEEYIETPPAGIHYGDHHFKVFEIPAMKADSNTVLFYYQGSRSDTAIDRLGNLLQGPYKPEGVGKYRLLDPKSCQITSYLLNAPAESFSFYYRPDQHSSIRESALTKLGEKFFVLSGTLNARFKVSIMNLHDLSRHQGQLHRPECRFDAAFE